MKKYFLTTALMVGFVAPAFGVDKIITSANTCTVDVLGVSDNNATAKTIATWTPVIYECAPGQYLLETETSVECTPCPIGSYCPGGTYTVESENTGATTCPTDYTSDASATAESECYMGCELACSVNVACPAHSNNCTHSAFKTTGKQNVGGTCNAYPSVCPITDFGCDVGYHKETLAGGSFVFDDAIVLMCDLDNQDVTISTSFIPDNGINDCDILNPGQIVLIHKNYEKAVFIQFTRNNYNPDTISGIKSVTFQEYSECEGEACSMITVKYLENANFQYEINGDYIWYKYQYVAVPDAVKQELLYSAADEFYSSGSLSSETMTALQNNLSVESLMLLQNVLQNGNNFTQEQLDSVMGAIMFLNMNQIETNLPWQASHASLEDLEEYGFFSCLVGMASIEEIAPDWTVSYCTANTININWNPDNDGAHIKNMCTYDGSITVPADPVKPGYTFMGWKLLEEDK